MGRNLEDILFGEAIPCRQSEPIAKQLALYFIYLN